jgi:hypothetical protein
MPLVFTTTAQQASNHGVKVCVHGPAGAGKTTLISTAPRPIIFSAEAGTLSIAKHNIAMSEIRTLKDLQDAYAWVMGAPEARNFDTVCLDSITEIANRFLSDEKKGKKDPRQAYGEMADQIAVQLRLFRDIPGKHVYFSAQSGIRELPDGSKIWHPIMPGKNTLEALPFYFDEVFYLGVGETPNTQVIGGPPIVYRYIQTQRSSQYEAKDRSGVLDPMEPPNLSHIFNKIAAATMPPPI